MRKLPLCQLTECQLVLRVHERRRCAAPHAVDTACAQDTVANDLLILGWSHCVPDLASQLLTDDAPFPHAAAPQCKADYEQKWQEDHELEHTAAQEGVQEPNIGVGLMPGWRLSRSRSRKCGKQWQGVVQHVRGDRKRDPDD